MTVGNKLKELDLLSNVSVKHSVCVAINVFFTEEIVFSFISKEDVCIVDSLRLQTWLFGGSYYISVSYLYS